MKKLREKIIKNFDRFKSFFIDNEIYEETEIVFVEEIIKSFFNQKNFKFILNNNDLIISICKVSLFDDKNNKINKIGCIKTELDEFLNDSGALQIVKCYLNENKFN